MGRPALEAIHLSQETTNIVCKHIAATYGDLNRLNGGAVVVCLDPLHLAGSPSSSFIVGVFFPVWFWIAQTKRRTKQNVGETNLAS